jgi:hypothetical protein
MVILKMEKMMGEGRKKKSNHFLKIKLKTKSNEISDYIISNIQSVILSTSLSSVFKTDEVILILNLGINSYILN